MSLHDLVELPVRKEAFANAAVWLGQTVTAVVSPSCSMVAVIMPYDYWKQTMKMYNLLTANIDEHAAGLSPLCHRVSKLVPGVMRCLERLRLDKPGRERLALISKNDKLYVFGYTERFNAMPPRLEASHLMVGKTKLESWLVFAASLLNWLDLLQKHRMVHFDMLPQNLAYRPARWLLIDFGFAMINQTVQAVQTVQTGHESCTSDSEMPVKLAKLAQPVGPVGGPVETVGGPVGGPVETVGGPDGGPVETVGGPHGTIGPVGSMTTDRNFARHARALNHQILLTNPLVHIACNMTCRPNEVEHYDAIICELWKHIDSYQAAWLVWTAGNKLGLLDEVQHMLLKWCVGVDQLVMPSLAAQHYFQNVKHVFASQHFWASIDSVMHQAIDKQFVQFMFSNQIAAFKPCGQCFEIMLDCFKLPVQTLADFQQRQFACPKRSMVPGSIQAGISTSPTSPTSPTSQTSQTSPTSPTSQTGQTGQTSPTSPTGQTSPTSATNPARPTDPVIATSPTNPDRLIDPVIATSPTSHPSHPSHPDRI